MTKDIDTSAVIRRQREFYNKKYAQWPQLKSVDLFWKHVSDEIIRLLHISKGKRYLYLGVGDGFIVEYIANKTGATIYGIDVSDYSLNYCNSKKGKTTFYINGDAQNLPFKNSSFNGVIAPAVLHHLPDLRSTFLEFRRVLTDDKIVYSIDPRDYGIRRFLNLFISRIISEDEIQLKQKDVEGLYRQSGFDIKSSAPSYFIIPIIVPLFKRIRLDLPERLFNMLMKADIYCAKLKFLQRFSWTFTIVATC